MINNPELPLVTIVTPSLNQGRFIENTIQSVLNQDYPNIEYMIIDGGSTDSTLEIIEKYADRLTWISEPDSGQSHAINKGFKKAKGEIVAWLNSDDTYEPGAVTKAVEMLTAKPEVMLVYGDANLINDKGDFIAKFSHSRHHDLWVLVNELTYIVQPTAFIRKSALSTVGYVDENLNWVMDWDLWIRISIRFPAYYIDSTIANSRIYQQTKTASGGIPRYFEIINILNKYSSRRAFSTYVRYGFNMITEFLKTRIPRPYPYIEMIFNPIRMKLRNKIANNHGVYADNWLAQKACFLFPVNIESSNIRFALELPDDKRLMPNYLQAKFCGKTIAAVAMATPGRHELIVPYDRTAEKPVEIELIFSKALPRDSQHRRLSCRLAATSFVHD